jgi:hypothetical protein
MLAIPENKIEPVKKNKMFKPDEIKLYDIRLEEQKD